MKTNLVILASGFSHRFQANKLLHKLNGKPIIQYILDTSKQCNFNQIYVVTQYEEVHKLAKEYGYLSIHNENAQEGISQSIKLAVHACKECDQIMFITADQPYIQASTINSLCAMSDIEHIISAQVKGVIKNPMLFPSIYFDELLNLSKEEGGKKVAMQHKDKIKSLEVNEKELHDIDTIEDIL